MYSKHKRKGSSLSFYFTYPIDKDTFVLYINSIN